MNKAKALVTALLILFINITAFAQCDAGGPGGLGDPDGDPCPLDTWVIALAAVVLLCTVWHLHKKQKALATL